MKISICIPQYNRIAYLLKSLADISRQTYDDIEICISDDCSSDDTVEEIEKLQRTYRYPIVFTRFARNQGYDCNLRRSMEIASGEYCFALGNDDTLDDPGCIARMVRFLEDNARPEIGYCNYRDYSDTSNVARKALTTTVVGSGPGVALRYYASFICVAGYIIRRDLFVKYNTARFDGSVYVQMYFATRAIAEGHRFFTLDEVMVRIGVSVDAQIANSYREKLVRRWSRFRVIDGGLPDVVRVVINGFQDAGVRDREVNYRVIRKHYTRSMPYWLLEYRNCGALVDALGLSIGMFPSKMIGEYPLTTMHKMKLYGHWLVFSAIGLLTPVFLFNKLRVGIYNRLKRKQEQPEAGRRLRALEQGKGLS